MNLDEIKEFLKKVKDDPALAARESDDLDRIIQDVIQLEKKHLYGTGTTSAARRREEIEKYLDKKLKDLIESN